MASVPGRFVPRPSRNLFRLVIAMMVVIVGGQGGASAQPISRCGTRLTLTNIYGVSFPGFAEFTLWVTDTSNRVVWSREVSTGASNSSATVSFSQDENGNPLDFPTLPFYTVHIDISGFGVCCGAFSSFTLTLSDDFTFDSGNQTVSGFLPPGTNGSLSFDFHPNPSGTACPVIVDPVSELLDTTFSAFHSFLQSPKELATKGRDVQGVSADGVTRVIVRIPADYVGQQFNLSMWPSGGATVRSHGGLARVEDTVTNTTFVTQLNSVTAQYTSTDVAGNPTACRPGAPLGCPMAFVVFQAPMDFVRDPQDEALASRQVYLIVDSDDAVYLAPISVVRPLVVMVHGLWGGSATWDDFKTIVDAPNTFAQERVNFDTAVAATATFPTFNSSTPITGNSLGYSYNAPNVFKLMRQYLRAFRNGDLFGSGLRVAAAQVDVVAHSMGGVISRTIPYLVSDFYAPDNYLAGFFHKLITVGTPHLGSPLAIELLPKPDPSVFGSTIQDEGNQCVARALAMKGMYSFSTVTVGGITYGGAVNDLRGDGQGGAKSGALKRLELPLFKPYPMASVGGVYDSNATTNLSLFLASNIVPLCEKIFNLDPAGSIPDHLSSSGWPVLLGGESDAIVPLTSALAFVPDVVGETHFTGSHSGALEFKGLGFTGPHILEPTSGVPARVLQLLNAPTIAPAFVSMGRQ